MNITIRQWIQNVWRSPLKLNGFFLMLNSAAVIIETINLSLIFKGFKGNDYDYSSFFYLLSLSIIISSFFVGRFFYINNQSRRAELILKIFLYSTLLRFSITSQYLKLSYSFLVGIISSMVVGFNVLVSTVTSSSINFFVLFPFWNGVDFLYSYDPTPESFYPYGLGIGVNVTAILLLIHLKVFSNKTHMSTSD